MIQNTCFGASVLTRLVLWSTEMGVTHLVLAQLRRLWLSFVFKGLWLLEYQGDILSFARWKWQESIMFACNFFMSWCEMHEMWLVSLAHNKISTSEAPVHFIGFMFCCLTFCCFVVWLFEVAVVILGRLRDLAILDVWLTITLTCLVSRQFERFQLLSLYSLLCLLRYMCAV